MYIDLRIRVLECLGDECIHTIIVLLQDLECVLVVGLEKEEIVVSNMRQCSI